MNKLWTILFAGAAVVYSAFGHTANAQVAQLNVLYRFACGASVSLSSCGASPLLADAAGNLYGTTTYGGNGEYCPAASANGCGVLFELHPQDGGAYLYIQLYAFCSQPACADGKNPSGHLISDVNGNIYGTTQFGGAAQQGIIYRLSSSSVALTDLYDFCAGAVPCTVGGNPKTGLAYIGPVYDGVSPLFGSTSNFGAFGSGTVYELPGANGTNNAALLLHAFNCSGTSCGASALVSDALITVAAGKFYGATTYEGGKGTVYSLTPNSTGYTYQLLQNFSACNVATCPGYNPSGDLILDVNGNIYGTAQSGYLGNSGDVYELSPQGAFISQWFLCSANCTIGGQNFLATGGVPLAGLSYVGQGHQAYDGTSLLFGTASQGGPAQPPSSGAGTVFELAVNHTNPTALWTFSTINAQNGETPTTSVTLDSSGNIFGTTSLGGVPPNGSGVAFEVTPAP